MIETTEIQFLLGVSLVDNNVTHPPVSSGWQGDVL